VLNPLGQYEHAAVLHVHSDYSDGTGTPEMIIAQAQRAGLDVLWLTDHDTRQALKMPGAGYYGKMLFLVGAEITPPTNHYLVFGDVPVVPAATPLQQVVDHVREQGGVGFVAHPDDPGNRTAHLPSYAWTERTVDGFTGLEIWNHVSDWARQIKNLAGGVWAAWHPFSGLEQAWPATVKLWDEWGQKRPVVGIGGADAHAARVGRLPFRFSIFRYSDSFRAIRTHLYTEHPLDDDWRAAEAQLVEALRCGRAAVVNAAVGREKGFRLWAEHARHEPHPMGSVLAYSPGWQLKGLSPVSAEWQWVRDGQVCGESVGSVASVPVAEPGVWRAVLRRGGRTWLYSNPLYFR
jgi:hypothetical protein